MPTQGTPRKIDIVILAFILALGIFLRLPPRAFAQGEPLHSMAALHPQPAFTQVGFDEGLYREYVNALIKNGIISYPDIVEGYIDVQKKMPSAILPPVRFLYVFAGYIWHSVCGCEALEALRQIAAFFSVLTLGLAITFAWRLRGWTWALGVGALMAFAPTQIHMSQHALIDGFFTFWALLCLWLLWENLGAPHDWRWLVAYGLALALLVTTKENSFFVWVALAVLIVVNRWLQFGTVTRELLLGTVAGPLLGVVMLVFLAGGLGNLLTTYQLLVSKASQTPYAILTGDGPWYRYLVDLLLVSPVILILALGSVFQLDRTKKPELFMLVFIAASYLVMCNVKCGMNLRYANMWDMPLRFLAFGSLVGLVAPIRRYRNIVLGVGVALICVIELRQYYILAVQYPLYELITHDLMRALHILKSPP
jgi:4-amino-4-deoxy-L-arabinose transferase-like glycosyltransferase